MTAQNKSVMAFNLSYLFDKVEMFSTFVEELIDDIEKGRIAPSPVKVTFLDCKIHLYLNEINIRSLNSKMLDKHTWS